MSDQTPPVPKDEVKEVENESKTVETNGEATQAEGVTAPKVTVESADVDEVKSPRKPSAEIKPSAELRQQQQQQQQRRGSVSPTVSTRTSTLSNNRATPLHVFILQALDTISQSREGRKGELKDAVTAAVAQINSSPELPTPDILFPPLKLACKTHNYTIQAAAIDCLAKLCSYSYFTTRDVSYVVSMIGAVSACFKGGDSTPDAVQLHIVRALHAAVVSTTITIHAPALLTAIRTTYDIFLFSLGLSIQMAAEASLGQMIDTVFARALNIANQDHDKTETAASTPRREKEEFMTSKENVSEQQITSLRDLENRTSIDDLRDDEEVPGDNIADHDETDLYIKDAFLVFRAMCKLSNKSMESEAATDLKSFQMRSKLLSLKIIYHILDKYMPVFTKPVVRLKTSTSTSTSFLSAVKQYLCLSLSRNSVHPNNAVFEISCDIFWKLLSSMRMMLKKEIEVFLNEIFLPILEMRTSSMQQKQYFLGTLQKLSQDPQALVEIYLNYDCDPSLDNIYERTISVISNLGKHDELKSSSVICLVSILRSLVSWSSKGIALLINKDEVNADNKDDPSEFENVRIRKTELMDGIRKFNFKPKLGLQVLIDGGFIAEKKPELVAKFLLETEGLNKATIGGYLGEADTFNVSVMHAFVDLLDFTNLEYVPAIRKFLQTFRLPGEAQQIDRIILKFADRYTEGNPGKFANADTAYTLGYSVIMLNTDQFSSKVKRRMTKQDFIKNNRGINDGGDLPLELLEGIFDDISNNEIVLEDERGGENALPMDKSTGFLATVGRDMRKDAYSMASEDMANKTQGLFKSLMKAQRKTKAEEISSFTIASHVEHAGPMFEIAWIPFLAGISQPMQDSDDEEIIGLCIEGFKLSIRLVCLFDKEYQRNAFITTLAKFTYLNNVAEMKTKNIEAIKALLEAALSEGNQFKESWKEVLVCVSQLERFQLIGSGVDASSVPNVSSAANISRASTSFSKDIAEQSRSRDIMVAADRIFAQSPQLSGDGIMYFVKALTDVSWQEIQSSGTNNEHPRLFSLQKIIDISYYNMGRIKVEWGQIWTVLGEHFNRCGDHPNTGVSIFAMDSLRQLSIRFLEQEELPRFQFQKDFLKPFEHCMQKNPSNQVKDMILRCIHQMIQSKVNNIKSGWRAIFGVLTFAAKEGNDTIATFAFQLNKLIHKKHLSLVIANGSFTDLMISLTEFSKSRKVQKVNLQAIDLIKLSIAQMLKYPDIMANANDAMITYWYPVLFALHDIIMTGEDLEVRSRSLEYLFDILRKHGEEFPADFWDIVCRQLLFPIFTVLKSRSDLARFDNAEDMSVWLSTTLIQALRSLIGLFTHYFKTLERMLDGCLDLLISCICQENDALARIGSSCLQQLILEAADQMTQEHWEKVVKAFEVLFEVTTANQLFDQKHELASVNGSHQVMESLISPANGENDHISDVQNVLDLQNNGNSAELPRTPDSEIDSPIIAVDPNKKKEFKQIIVKCVLQLLMIDTIHELLTNDSAYKLIPTEQILALNVLLQRSFYFARRFNNDKDLRNQLWKMGFMKQLPNLLKQETTSAATIVHILIRLYNDPEREDYRGSVEAALIPLCVEALERYNQLDGERDQRSIAAWTPVILEVLTGLGDFNDADFAKQIPSFYFEIVNVLSKDVAADIRVATRKIFERFGKLTFSKKL